MSEHKIPIPGRIYNASGGNVCGVDDVIDDVKGKKQSQINTEIDERTSTLEQNVGPGGSVDERITEAKTELIGDAGSDYNTLGKLEDKIQEETAARLNEHYLKTETYNKNELNNLITTPNQEYVTVTATDQTTAATDVLPATGSADTIYRVGNWDGTQYSEVDYTEYAWNGSAYVKLDTKSQIGEVYDISANHAGTTYADLAAALGTNGANIPQSLRKGGMSVKFVSSSDNNYTQFRCKTQLFSANPEDWYFEGDDTLVENPEYLKVVTDGAGHLLGWIRKSDGGIDWAVGVPRPIREYVDAKVAEIWNGDNGTQIDGLNKIIAFLDGLSTSDTLTQLLNEKVNKEEGKSLIDSDFAQGNYYVEDSEHIDVKTDGEGKILESHRKDGTKIIETDEEVKGNSLFHKDVEVRGTLQAESIVINDEGGFESPSISVGGVKTETIEDQEGRMEIKTDGEGKIIKCRKADGTLVENVGIETNNLKLTEQGMTEFQQELKNAGFKTGGAGDYSDYITNKGKKPVHIPTPRCAMLNILSDVNLTTLSKSDQPSGVQKVNYDVKVQVEFFDGQGIYFKKTALIGAQGNSSLQFDEKNISLKLFDTDNVENSKGKWGKGDTFGTVFGDWVMQKTYHLKSYYTDFIKGSAVIAYQLANEVYKTRGVYADRPWKQALINFNNITDVTPANLSEDGINDMNLQIDNGAMCMPDGFPVIVYQQGEFYGIFCWQLKKDSDNFNLDTSKTNNIHLDGNLNGDTLWQGSINWSKFEIRNPEDLIDMDGNDYDGDFPTELISPTIIVEGQEVPNPNWDGSKNQVRSYQVKQYIESLSNRVSEIYTIGRIIDPTDSSKTIIFGEYKGEWNTESSYNRNEWVIYDGSYYVSLHNRNVSHLPDKVDSTHWYNIDTEVAGVRNAFKTYFDVDNVVDYQLINMACGDPDGFNKNWQWVTYDGVKWWVNQYDKDQAFGNNWRGMYTDAPIQGWLGNHILLPSGLAIRYFQDEHKQRWNDLVSAGLFTADHIKKLVTDWVARIGKSNYQRNYDRWNQAPCNRDSYIDYDNWIFTGNFSTTIPVGENEWDFEQNYSIDNVVWFKGFEDNWYLQFKAIANNNGCPCIHPFDDENWSMSGYYDEEPTGTSWNKDTSYSIGDSAYIVLGGRWIEFTAIKANKNNNPYIGYTIHPVTLGYRDSIWRYYKYIEELISKQNDFINSL